MALLSSFGAWKEKFGRVPNERGRIWGGFEYLLYIGGLCTIIGSVWLGWRYDRFEAIWRLWQEESKYDFEPSSPKEWHGHAVNISIIASAVNSGAVCLDGSRPAYFLDRGTGEGVNNWVVFLEGGGWCENDLDCLERAFTGLGSSKYMPRRSHLGGILSSSPSANPDFYNWNRVLVKYCDGGSFSGDVSEPTVGLIHNGNKAAPLFYRGQRIWKAVMEELMEIGMKKAEKAFLAGCSAGGLASILHCDQYRDLMPKKTMVKCLSDAGFFIDIPDISGVQTIEAYYAKVVRLHNMSENLPKSCISEREVTKCFFPEYLIMGLKTPIFILNPAYDTWQFDSVLLPPTADPDGVWDDCRIAFSSCSESQLRVVQGFREGLLKRLQPFLDDEKNGAFINSCYLHCQSQAGKTWSGPKCPRVDNKSSAQVVGDWYFERNVTKVIDCQYPCNPTCRSYSEMKRRG